MEYFSVETTSILIQKTGISIAEKSTLMKIVINKHCDVCFDYLTVLPKFWQLAFARDVLCLLALEYTWKWSRMR